MFCQSKVEESQSGIRIIYVIVKSIETQVTSGPTKLTFPSVGAGDLHVEQCLE